LLSNARQSLSVCIQAINMFHDGVLPKREVLPDCTHRKFRLLFVLEKGSDYWKHREVSLNPAAAPPESAWSSLADCVPVRRLLAPGPNSHQSSLRMHQCVSAAAGDERAGFGEHSAIPLRRGAGKARAHDLRVRSRPLSPGAPLMLLSCDRNACGLWALEILMPVVTLHPFTSCLRPTATAAKRTFSQGCE
jgi:hypothetical protein